MPKQNTYAASEFPISFSSIQYLGQVLPIPPQVLWSNPFSPQRAEAEGVVAFGEARAGFISEERAMAKLWWSQAKRAVEQQLAGGGFEEVFATHDFGDLHRGVINDYCELVSRDAVVPPNYEITEICSRHELLSPVMAVHK